MKKTLLSFLCIGSAFMTMAQTTPAQQTRPSTEPSLNRNTTTTPTSVNNQQPTNNTLNNNPQQPPNSTLNNTTQQPNSTLNNSTQQPANSTINNSTQQQNGAVNGHNTMMDANRNYPGNNNMNNTQPNSTLNGNTTPNGNMNNSNMNNMNNANMNGTVNGTLGSTTANAAYSVTVPTSVQTTFTTAYPAAGNAVWSQSGDWYRARYMENGKLMEASYREDGKAFTRPASPIMRTFVPEETVSKALEIYGMNVYAIAGSKGADGQMRYNVTIIENGQSRTEWMNEDGSTVMNPYRTEMDDQSANQQMNTNGQQATEPVTTDQATPATSTNSATPATDPQNNTNINTNGTQQQSTLQQGNGQPQVAPNNRLNTNGINNATGSDSLMRKRNDVPKQ